MSSSGMIKVCLTVGCPASGKSTWAKAEVARDPNNYVRINNDDLRMMLNGAAVHSAESEKMITDARNYLIRDAMKRGKNVIIDNVNANRRHFDDVCKMAKSVNMNIQVYEKSFFVDLEELIERDSKRTGNAKVGEEVIRKFWKQLGGKGHAFYKPRTEIFSEHSASANLIPAPVWDKNLPTAVLCDLDGTLALIHNRSPYDASNCENDFPNVPVVESIKMYAKAGYKIVFCSGREDQYGGQTRNFIEMHCGDMPYKLHMRKSGDFRKDSIIKEEIYEEHIKGRYNVSHVLDDRDQVVSLWRSLGLSCWQVAPGNF